MIPLNERLFPHIQGGELYFHANGLSMQTNNELLIERSRACALIPFSSEFVQFHNTTTVGDEIYALISGMLLCFNASEVQQVCSAPQSSCRYKLACLAKTLYCVGELGELYLYNREGFELTDSDFLRGDSYIYSQSIGDVDIEIAINLTTQILHFKAGEYQVRQGLADCLTVDLITPFYILLHGARGSLFVDLTTRTEGFEVHYTEEREKLLEWNELPENLQLFNAIWLCKTDILKIFSKLDNEALEARINALIGARAEPIKPEHHRPHKLESNEIWEFGQPKEEIVDIVTDMRGNAFEFKKPAAKIVSVHAETTQLSQKGGPVAEFAKNVPFTEKVPQNSDLSVSAMAEMQLALIQQGQKIENLEKEVEYLKENSRLTEEMLMEALGMLDDGKKTSAFGSILKKMNAK